MWRQFLPRSLFARALIIVVAPVVILQLVLGGLFYDRHLDTVVKRLVRGVVGDIVAVIDGLERSSTPVQRERVLADAMRHHDLLATYLPPAPLEAEPPDRGMLERQLHQALSERINRPFATLMRRDAEAVAIRIAMPDGVLLVMAPLNRLTTTSTARLLGFWMIGTSIALLAVATIFLRNQVRPIRRLAEAADAFGKGREVDDFRPSGAREVRQAAIAFQTMRERIRRAIDQRTDMLAGVSHDLRTPLTRMKLELALLGDNPQARELAADIAEMERMVAGYLAFARGQDGENAEETDLAVLLADVAGDARRQGAEVTVSAPQHLALEVRPQALKRCLANLVENARRYGGRIWIGATRKPEAVEITVDDDGPGIPKALREEVFRPFRRLDESRNPDTGGVGLGLAIARDVARGHGGDILLEDAPTGGLRALVRLPV
jgi:two-component system, OmpR family, osmolarity sensor histidine kinase EnvZ